MLMCSGQPLGRACWARAWRDLCEVFGDDGRYTLPDLKYSGYWHLQLYNRMLVSFNS